jgi:soluble lytic murein transglycosylase
MIRRLTRIAGKLCALALLIPVLLGDGRDALAGVKKSQRFDPPSVLTSTDADLYRRGFAAVRAGRLADATQLAAATSDPVLRGSLLAETMLAGGSLTRTSADLVNWLRTNRDHAQAPRIYAVVATTLPAAPKPIESKGNWGVWLTKKPPRLATQFERNTARLAWDYYSVGQLSSAIARANSLTTSPTPESGFAHWVAGLAAWRQGDCTQAAEYFQVAASKPAMSDEMLSASLFWAARSQQQCGKFDEAVTLFKLATETGDTFYGLLANRMIGISPGFAWQETSLTHADWKKISASSALRRISALVEVGEYALADEELRNYWGRASANQWAALVAFAERKKLWGAKLSIARRPPPGLKAGKSAYYPLPDYWSTAGSAVPRSLVLAFMRQESAFRMDTVSRANARGLMQFMPATAREIAQDESISESDPRLNDPGFSVQLGKTYLRRLANSSITGGNLLKVVASYNAGPGNVRNWNSSLPDSDPLLYLESIPLPETRDYVENVIKNYWMYQKRLGEPTTTLDALARGEWPVFPNEKMRDTVSNNHNSVAGDAYANR